MVYILCIKNNFLNYLKYNQSSKPISAWLVTGQNIVEAWNYMEATEGNQYAE